MPRARENGGSLVKISNRKDLLCQALEALESDPLLITNQQFKTHLVMLKSLANKAILKGGNHEPQQKTNPRKNSQKDAEDKKVKAHA